ncbi:MAG: DUF5110 domain-containing protein [Eubacterium sp.]|nr:DUF5110 domain-containing protein [Eubacterium sp.]
MLKKSLIAKTNAKANEKQIAIIGNTRITYLTPRLIRVEKDNFSDLASFSVWFRNFEAGDFSAINVNGEIVVETSEVIFNIKKGKPYSVYFKDSKKTEVFSNQKNLKGTRRTLDGTSGKVKLGEGLITEGGAYLFDDSKSMLLDENGRFIPRKSGSKDYYAFAYGKDYRQTIRAFYMISSQVPLVPRFALGVWWSRYHAYTQKEYLDLMKRFKDEEIPLTVATVDMDWHWVHNIKEKFGVDYGGWTGYSWNTELFPDYREFLKKLKEDNLHITLNLHPADGVHKYEDMYEEMAKATGVDPKTGKKVDFSLASDEFWNAYFDILHKPYEKDGVDFWWIDWQQGTKVDVEGLDPLNALNHYHFLDNAESGQMPLILSRYAGMGSHRYPLGFSGDTAITWKTFDFQPYFTANAANAAYTWWSHDIGGHHQGYRDDDLYLRWLEFGVFSPIMRLHSTAIELLGKEPWKYKYSVYQSAKYWLNLRHRLIPYIFTMGYRTHLDGIALCEPMYYSYPENKNAYKCPNQYMFGSELMVCPITQKNHKSLNMGSVTAWLPRGEWIDIFTNQRYKGEGFAELFRDTEFMPVLAKEGAIIPLSADSGNSVENPENLEIIAFSGGGEFTLIEDNSKTDYINHIAKTKFEMTYENEVLTFKINKAEGDLSVIPEKRNYKIRIKDAGIEFEINGADVKEEHIRIFENAKRLPKEDDKQAVIRILSRWQATTVKKQIAYKPFEKAQTKKELFAALDICDAPSEVKNCIKESLNQI